MKSLLQVNEVKEVLSPVAQVGVVGAFCLLFIAAIVYLFKQLKEERTETAKEREKTMSKFEVLFDEIRQDAKETKAELKGVIEKNTTGFVEMTSTLRQFQRDMDRNK